MLKAGSLPRILDRKGQSIVEISLITPLLLIALYVPADFAIAYLTAHLTQNAVRDAVRIGAASKDPFDAAAATAIRTEALNRMPNRLSSKAAVVKFFDTGVANCEKFVEVTGQGDYNYFFYKIMRLVGATVPPSTTITRISRMRYEYQPDTNSTPCATAGVIMPPSP
jgi:Flp pilus assembly protein TadG